MTAIGFFFALLVVAMTLAATWVLLRNAWLGHSGRGRKEALREVATELGFEFEDRGSAASIPSAVPVGPLRRVLAGLHSRIETLNVLHAMRGDTWVAVYDYRESGGSTATGYSMMEQTHVEILDIGVTLPVFRLSRETVGHVNLFGIDPDIDFESHPGFSRRFFLTGPDRDAVRGLFTPALLDFLVEHVELFTNVGVMVDERSVFTVVASQCEPEEIEALLTIVERLWRLLTGLNRGFLSPPE